VKGGTFSFLQSLCSCFMCFLYIFLFYFLFSEQFGFAFCFGRDVAVVKKALLGTDPSPSKTGPFILFFFFCFPPLLFQHFFLLYALSSLRGDFSMGVRRGMRCMRGMRWLGA